MANATAVIALLGCLVGAAQTDAAFLNIQRFPPAMRLLAWLMQKPGTDAQARASTAAQQELARFQGAWQLVSAESDGELAPPDRVRHIQVTITGQTHTVRSKDRVLAHDVHFDLDPTRTPKQVTDTLNSGPGAGQRIRGIYKLDGDTLISCVGQAGKPRPTDFTAGSGSGHSLRVFRRVRNLNAETKSAVDAELKRFEGTWRFQSVEVEGKGMSADSFKGNTLTLDGDRFTAELQGPALHGLYEVDPTAMPKSIDVTFGNGEDRGQTVHGIYELDGDSYRVCMGLPGKPRPTEFSSKPGSGQVLEVLKREKPADATKR